MRTIFIITWIFLLLLLLHIQYFNDILTLFRCSMAGFVYFLFFLQQVDEKHGIVRTSSRNAHYTKQRQANPSHDKLESSAAGSHSRGDSAGNGNNGGNAIGNGISSLTALDRNRGECCFFLSTFYQQQQNHIVHYVLYCNISNIHTMFNFQTSNTLDIFLFSYSLVAFYLNWSRYFAKQCIYMKTTC